MRLLPGDPIYMLMTHGQIYNSSPEQIQALRAEYGLDKPLPIQYFNWVAGIFHGDFGISLVYHVSPLKILARTVPVTLNINLPAFFIAIVLGIAAGIISGIRRNTWMDSVVTVMANVGITIPVFWLGTILIYVFA